MFKELSQAASALRNLPRLKEEMEKFQAQLDRIIGEGDAGGGAVRARVNGKFELLACTFRAEDFRPEDRELIEDLVVAAVNQALERARQQVAAETARIASELGMPMPQGLNLPGLT